MSKIDGKVLNFYHFSLYSIISVITYILKNRKNIRVNQMGSRIEDACLAKGMKMTEQRRLIAQVLSNADDHPDVEEVYRRANDLDPRISIATVYRTLRLFEEASIIERHEFGDGRARYEEVTDDHHDHLIDIKSSKVVEFTNDEIERLQEEIAKEHGMKLVGHRLELYCVPINSSEE